MGLGGISVWQLLIILVIVLAIFGTKKLRNMGGDLGSAVKGFKNAVKEGTDEVGDAAEKGKQALEDASRDGSETETAKVEDKV